MDMAKKRGVLKHYAIFEGGSRVEERSVVRWSIHRAEQLWDELKDLFDGPAQLRFESRYRGQGKARAVSYDYTVSEDGKVTLNADPREDLKRFLGLTSK